MRAAKIVLLLSAVGFGVVSVLLFVFLLFKSSVDPIISEFAFIDDTYKICAVISIVFVLLYCAVIVLKKHFTAERVLLSVIAVLYIGFSAFIFNTYSDYNAQYEIWCNSEHMPKNVEISDYLPYSDEFEKMKPEDHVFQVGVTETEEMTYVSIFDEVSKVVYYNVEFFVTGNNVLCKKFVSDREVESVFNNYESEVWGEETRGTVEGLDYKLYVYNDRYTVAITSEEYGYYASVSNSKEIGISAEDFIKTSVSNFSKIQGLAKEPELLI